MSFLTPILLTLAGFAAIPVLLHLIRRKRVRILDFPTFRLLKKAAMEQRFHLRLQDQLLMFLRMLILLLLAIAFAGPSIKRTFSAGTRYLGLSNILVVDDSLSMSVVQNGMSLYESALSTAKSLLESKSGTWKVVFASEVMSASDPLKSPITDVESLEEVTVGKGPLSFRGPMSAVVAKLRSTRKPDEPIWLITDRTGSNWKDWSFSRGEESGTTQVEVLQVGEEVKLANAAVWNMSLVNEPLFEDEPALLSVAYEIFGATGPRPLGVQVGWRGKNTEKSGILPPVPIPESSTGQGTIESLIEAAGQVASVSAQLRYAEGVADPLPADDLLEIQPRVLSQIRIQLVTANTEWRNLLQASLVGFDLEMADPLQPPPPTTTTVSAHILLLGAEPPMPEWGAILRARIQSGAGLVVFYDQPADGLRNQVWQEWWRSWEFSGLVDSAPKESMSCLAGADPWFVRSLDRTAWDPKWMEPGFSFYFLDDWTVEMAAQTPSKSEFPLLQTHQVGQGVVVVWTVPLSLKNTPLILTTGWVPLLSNIVKRSLINPNEFGSLGGHPERASESDLHPLSSEERIQLEQQGCLFSDAAETSREIETLPRTQQDWTPVVLMLCLGLALFEIGLSNYL